MGWASSPGNTAGGRDGPIEGWSRSPGSQKEGGEVVVKPNTTGGSVSPSKTGPESVYYYLAVQYSWSVQRPDTRADEGGGPYQGLGAF